VGGNLTFLGTGSVVLGIIGGIYGPLFIYCNTQVNKIRKRVLDKNWKKVIETPILCFITASVLFFVPYIRGHCLHKNSLQKTAEDTGLHRVWCDSNNPLEPLEEMYSPLATLYWASEGGIIRNMMNSHFYITMQNEWIFIFVWAFFMSITYGTNVPSGLFLPGMIIGSAVGQLYARCLAHFELVPRDE